MTFEDCVFHLNYLMSHNVRCAVITHFALMFNSVHHVAYYLLLDAVNYSEYLKTHE